MERGNLRRVVDDVTASFAVDENGPKASGRGGNLITAPRTRTGKRDCSVQRGGRGGGGRVGEGEGRNHPSGRSAQFSRVARDLPTDFRRLTEREIRAILRCEMLVDRRLIPLVPLSSLVCHPRDWSTG